MRTRLLIGAVGVAMGAFGALRLLQLDLPDVVDALLWLAGGVLLHDAVIAPLTIGLTVLATRVVPPRARVRVTVGLVVLATVTVTAVPVLGRFGEKPDNRTILDRDYVVGWMVFAVAVVVGTLVAGPLARMVRPGKEKPLTPSAG
ncbi:MAG: hypothetical protein JWR64_1703 [Marmoricola sp.]|nr:hypothetical protein [Marmoricola sp.]MCW2821908.1 hypothetical protein [Marmoricola sp.]